MILSAANTNRTKLIIATKDLCEHMKSETVSYALPNMGKKLIILANASIT